MIYSFYEGDPFLFTFTIHWFSSVFFGRAQDIVIYCGKGLLLLEKCIRQVNTSRWICLDWDGSGQMMMQLVSNQPKKGVFREST